MEDDHRAREIDEETIENAAGIPGITRRRVMQVTATGMVAGGLGFGTGIAGAELDDLCEPGKLDLMLVFDQSGSMRSSEIERVRAGAIAIVGALNVSSEAVHVGILTFGGGPVDDIPRFFPLTGTAANVYDVLGSLSPHAPGADSNMEAGVQAAREELTGNDYSDDISASGRNRSDVPKAMVLFSDGEPNLDNETDIDDPDTFPALGDNDPSEEANAAKMNDEIEIYTIGVDLDSASQDLMMEMASEPKATHAFSSVDIEAIEGTFEDVAADRCPTEVEIDIKPGSVSNPINCNSRREGVVPVAVLSTDTFDATTIDPGSLRFGSPDIVGGGGGATLAHGDGHLTDVDDDGDLDFLGHFQVEDTGFEKADTEGLLVGQAGNGEHVAGVDSVKVVGKCR